MKIYSPLEQFNINPIYFEFLYKIPGFALIFGYFPIITNSLIYILLGILCYYMFFFLSTYKRNIYSKTSWEFFMEKIYLLIQDIVSQSFEGKYERYLPFLFHTFFFILFSNLLGLMPYGFTNTSFLLENLVLSISFLIALTILGILKQGGHFFEHFVPKGIPVVLVPMLVIIEVISYVAKGFSLSIRLFANMMSGHTLLNILSSFSIKLSKSSLIVGLIPFIIVLAIAFLEVGISFLQAYVFMVLLTLYFNDSIKMENIDKGYMIYKKKKKIKFEEPKKYKYSR